MSKRELNRTASKRDVEEEQISRRELKRAPSSSSKNTEYEVEEDSKSKRELKRIPASKNTERDMEVEPKRKRTKSKGETETEVEKTLSQSSTDHDKKDMETVAMCIECEEDYCDDDANFCKKCGNSLMSVICETLPSTPEACLVPFVVGCTCTPRCFAQWVGWRCSTCEYIATCQCVPKCRGAREWVGWRCPTTDMMEM